MDGSEGGRRKVVELLPIIRRDFVSQRLYKKNLRLGVVTHMVKSATQVKKKVECPLKSIK